jgi:hypothetical protein
VEFDYGLVLAAAEASAAASGTEKALDRYRNAIARAEQENVLRRIGLLRVALHDLRELSFRKPGLPLAGEIWTLLASSLRPAIDQETGAPKGFKDHLTAFLEVVGGPPSVHVMQQPEVAAS